MTYKDDRNAVWARPLGRMPDGTKVSRFTVYYRTTNIMSRDFDYMEGSVTVTSANAGDACNWVMDNGEWTHPVEVWTYGPRGGKTQRFNGYESLVGRALMGGAYGDAHKQQEMES